MRALERHKLFVELSTQELEKARKESAELEEELESLKLMAKDLIENAARANKYFVAYPIFYGQGGWWINETSRDN